MLRRKQHQRWTNEVFADVCDLIFQVAYEGRDEPNLDPDRLRFTGEVPRAFALAIVDQVLGLDTGPICMDCGGRRELFMVHDEIWSGALLEPDDLVCIADLERRLGRPISGDDLTDAPANEGIRARIGARGA